jgi:hypothetical protein
MVFFFSGFTEISQCHVDLSKKLGKQGQNWIISEIWKGEDWVFNT